MKAFVLLIAFFGFTKLVSAQIDSNKTFLASKGLLPFPIESKSAKMSTEEIKYEELPTKKVTFFSDTSAKVNCIFDGTVLSIQRIEDMYVVITKFGDYFLTYAGLEKPIIQKGQFIKTGQMIAYQGKDYDNFFYVDIYLSKFSDQLDPKTWFKK